MAEAWETGLSMVRPVKSNGHSDQKGLGTACVKGLLLWKDSFSAEIKVAQPCSFPTNASVKKGVKRIKSRNGLIYIRPKIERAMELK